MTDITGKKKEAKTAKKKERQEVAHTSLPIRIAFYLSSFYAFRKADIPLANFVFEGWCYGNQACD